MTNATEQLSESDAQAVARAIQASMAKYSVKERMQMALGEARAGLVNKTELEQLRKAEQEWRRLDSLMRDPYKNLSKRLYEQARQVVEAASAGRPLPHIYSEDELIEQVDRANSAIFRMQLELSENTKHLVIKVLQRALALAEQRLAKAQQESDNPLALRVPMLQWAIGRLKAKIPGRNASWGYRRPGLVLEGIVDF